MVEVVVEAEGLAHPEGPASLPDGSIIFVETYREQVSRWRPGEGVSCFSDCGGGPNACALGSDGVYITQMGRGFGSWQPRRPHNPSVQKILENGTLVTVATSFDGRVLEAPNDLCFGPRGNLVFTDPGAFDPANPRDGYVFSLNSDGSSDFVVETGPTFPNGVVALTDGSIVWVESYTRAVRRRFEDGSLVDVARLPPGHMPDGLKAAADGALYIASIMSGGIDVVCLNGSGVRFLETGGQPLNCVFAGTDLLIADEGLANGGRSSGSEYGGRLLRVPVGVLGMATYLGQITAATQT